MPRFETRVRAAIAATTICAVSGGAGAVALAAVDTAGTDQPASSAAGHVLVRYAAGLSAAGQAAIEHANGAGRIGEIRDIGVDVLSVPVGAEQHVVAALRRSHKVDYAELDAIGHTTVTPNDPDFGQQWGLSKINAPNAWSTSTGSRSIVIADLDTGVDLSHPDLQGKSVAGYDFINNDSDPSDDYGHGTETAGIIAASTNNALGVAGVCWACLIMPVKVATSTGSAPWSAVASGITWATDHGARVVNMSLAGTSGSSALQSAVQYAVDHGVVLVAAAGNNGNSTPVYPASYAGVLSVAGTTSSDTLYSWSDYGSWVDVAAPGCDYTTAMGGGYTTAFCGTSAATPVVSGLAGLLAATDPTASATSITAAIQSSATDIGSVVADGRVDAAAAVAALGAPPTPSPSPTATATPTSSPTPAPTATATPSPSATTSTFSGSLSGKTAARSYSVATGAGTLSASLSFSRASAMTLRVTDASGNVVAASSGGTPVTVVATVAPGTYTLTVSAAERATYTLTVDHP